MPAGNGTGTTAITGTDGVAEIGDGIIILRLKNWSVNPTGSESAWGDSDSSGHTVRKLARKDCTGSLVGVLDENGQIYDVFKAGDILAPLVLWQSRTAGDYWYFGSALVTSFNLTSDIDTKEVMEWSMDFGADGIFFFPGQTNIPAVSVPA